MGVITILLGGRRRLSATVDEEDYRTLNLGSYKWFSIIGRTTTYVASRKNRKTIYLHRFIMGLENALRSVYVDHIDHNGLNNSRTNLRITDNKGNQHNSRKRLSAKNSSAYKGVSWSYSSNKLNPWLAAIHLSDSKRHIGYYRTEIEAAIAYNNAAIEHFGDMANLNVIEP